MNWYKIGLSLVLFSLFCPNLSAEESWEEQQEWAERQTANYLVEYPEVASDRYVFKKIVLPKGGTLELDLRIERPRDKGPFPVVVFVHGGGWITGNKSHFCHQSFELAKKGIAGVRIEYRWKSHGGQFTNVIKDILDAINFLRTRKSELNLDFTRLGLAGGSAGAHLSAIAAQLTPECICYDGYNGLYDLIKPGVSRFAGGSDFTGSSAKDKELASSIYQIKQKPPDTLLYHGSEDIVIDPSQSVRFACAIEQHGGSAKVLVYEGVGHSFFAKEPYLSQTTRALLDHVSYVFKLSNREPDLNNYGVQPKVAKHESGFSLIGQWNFKDDTSQLMIFYSDRSAATTNGEVIRWDERYGNYYVIWNWNEGVYQRINVLAANKIKIGKITYERSSIAKTAIPQKPVNSNVSWLANRHKQLSNLLINKEELEKVKVVFVGDSITQGWLNEGSVFWNKTFSKGPWHSLNLGVAGNRSEHLLQRIQAKKNGGMGQLDHPNIRPGVIVLMIGTNNLLSDNEPDEIIAGVLACKTRLQELEPQARIILCSVLPVSNKRICQEVVQPVNESLKLMHNPPELHWLDLYSSVANKDASPSKKYFHDGVHLNQEGYQVWHNQLLEMLIAVKIGLAE